ncbi:3-deoxy-manno-octulosonate cytidylyltransferase [Treponema endosymbiont of Eucomonympha sp.]|uniref:3-deoxy-manno-octulosonate cytidylyltransferase n=1 Tax=Treponema endosymbiont of Eucomonympha sp. TaxID=1580831 RepID=UPI000A80F148|nr:3-deoxy-manno-octulosonate cytidylyltransferase [Treponema endosymbiont of Eucomonympha sp.]
MCNDLHFIGVIPARYQSSRFPGKPLADICGKPMIWWTYQNAKKASGLDDLYVATDDQRIESVCNNLDIKTIMTSDKHTTGVERLAEVASRITSDYYILIQGDEPLLESETISDMIQLVSSQDINKDLSCVYTYKTQIHLPVDAVNPTIIKIATDLYDTVLLASRSPIPFPQTAMNFDYYKSVGVYAYPLPVLKNYYSLIKGPLDKAENHDFMRLLENQVKIKAITYDTETISVDTPKDLERVRRIISERSNTPPPCRLIDRGRKSPFSDLRRAA